MSYPFVEVRWVDAISVSSWVAPEDFPAPMNVLSRGWLVVDLPDYITLASTMHESEFGEVVTIPRGMVQSVQPLEVKNAGAAS